MVQNIDERTEYVARVQTLPWYDRLLGDFVAFLNPARETSILCVQGGSGGLAIKLAKRGLTVVNTDSSPDLVEFTRLAVKRGRARALETIKADHLQLPFEDGRFDMVVAVTLLGSEDDPVPALLEMGRVAAPAGVVATLDPSIELRSERALAFTARNSLRGFSFKAFQSWCQEAQQGERFSTLELESLYKRAGLVAGRFEEQMERMLVATIAHKSSTVSSGRIV